MNELTKGQKYLARAMVPFALGVAALGYLAWRPCEPVAQAATAPNPVVIPALETVPSAPIPVISVEDLPKTPLASRKVVAGVSRKPAMVCTPASPEWHCWDRGELRMGTVGTHSQECDCSKQ